MTTEKENKKFAEENCACSECPSFVECQQKTFCFSGKSKCIKEKKGCICGGCLVHKKFNFKNWYYCFSGKEK